jgi:hypothetical protein
MAMAENPHAVSEVFFLARTSANKFCFENHIMDWIAMR